jgi:hypothetical protein
VQTVQCILVVAESEWVPQMADFCLILDRPNLSRKSSGYETQDTSNPATGNSSRPAVADTTARRSGAAVV